ncbi:MAG: LAGLIDADG family homing endonuclease [bacterium]
MVRDPRGGHNRKKVNEVFFKTWTPNMAYVLGFMFADGSLLDTNKSSRTYYLLFSNNDFELLSKIKLCLNSEHAIYVRPPRLMQHRHGKYTSREGYVLKMGNKVMYQDLINLGMTHRKSNTMHLPTIPIEYFSYFLRGYFDGDGCINLYLAKGRMTNRLSVIYSSGSIAFLNELADEISSLLNIKSPRMYKSCGDFNLISHSVEAVNILDYMYHDLDKAPYLKYKYQKYLEYKDHLMGPRVKKALGLI